MGPMILAILIISDDGTPIATIEASEIEVDSSLITGALRIAKELITSFTGMRKDSLELSDGMNRIIMHEIANHNCIIIFIVRDGNGIDEIKINHIVKLLEIYGFTEEIGSRIANLAAKKPMDYRYLSWGAVW